MTKHRSIYAAKLNDFGDFAFGDSQAFKNRGGWRSYFASRMGPTFNGRIIFEIGCFDASYLSQLAAKNPQTAFIGLDWKFKSLYEGAAGVAKLGLRNVALLRCRAQDLRQIFADGEVDEVWVFHPDPCDRPVDLPNRLISEPFLLDVNAILREPGSPLCLKTDHPGYYQWVLGLLGLPEPSWFDTARQAHAAGQSRSTLTPKLRVRDLMQPSGIPSASKAVSNAFRVMINSSDFWQDEAAQAQTSERCFFGEKTFFERRFLSKRQPIFYIELRKQTA